MKTFRITYLLLLCAFILPVAAQESVMEQFMAEQSALEKIWNTIKNWWE